MNAPNIPDAIVGHEKLVAVLGRWPTFHDAEVLCMQLVRDEGRPFSGPVCTVAVCLQGEPGAQTSEGPMVTLRFYDLHDLRLASFNHQNPILGLEIAVSGLASKPHALASHVFDVTLQGVHEDAFSASFTCSRVEVVGVEAQVPHRRP
ncbi:MAG: immunity 50 family protein [Planctomycetes bacterium]|nr:immunity 50 family protein [Planctomycetota bacterium]MCC7397639.1 hypothetical protein [Planctomycetota bacterium]